MRWDNVDAFRVHQTELGRLMKEWDAAINPEQKEIVRLQALIELNKAALCCPEYSDTGLAPVFGLN